MTPAVFRRVAAMEPQELRFRLAGAARKTADRARTSVFGSRWHRGALLARLRRDAGTAKWAEAITMLERADYRGAHLALAAHFAARASAFPLNAADAAHVAGIVGHDFPDSRIDAARRADRLCAGRYDLLGHRDVRVGESPDWHLDAVHGRRSPRRFWSAVSYLDPLAGDHKVVWELNRHQHWLAFGRAHALTGERRFYLAFTAQLASWLAANPPLIGTNWASMLELAFRSISWLWMLELFAAAAGPDDREPWLVDLLLGLDRQLTHVEQNLSHYFSPNTHLSGEALALYAAGLTLPELRASDARAAAGREVLAREAARQVRTDGGHVELSTHYHRYSTDFYLLATALARRAADPALPIFEDAARRQARYLRAITDDRGMRPAIGDDDGGTLFPMCGRDPADCRDTLATAAILLAEPALSAGPIPEETYWICGAAARGDGGASAARWTSIALAASGYFVCRTPRGDHLIFDAGPHGFLNGGHAHSDALACVLSVAGRPVLIDPGTATYTMDRELRNRFRSTPMHNTVVFDGRPQSKPRGSFHWKSTAGARAPVWRSSSDCEYVEGTHDAYAPRRHTRAVLSVHGVGWWIVDHLLGSGSLSAEAYWHVDPLWQCRLAGDHTAHLSGHGSLLGLASTAPLTLLAGGEHPLALRSPAYGAVEPAPVLRAAIVGALPSSVATFIPATAEVADGLSIEELPVDLPPGADWHGRGFRLRWSRGAMALLSAVEQLGIADRDTAAPPGPWGTAGLRTDARAAALIDRAGGRSEVILINGAVATAHPGHPVVSLARRVPFLRMPASKLAPSVQEAQAQL